MTPDLLCLLGLALWSIPLNHIPAIARVIAAEKPLAWGMGNRETSPVVPPWVERADRAQRNHHDNLAMIATVIVITQLSGQADDVTALASVALLGLRILHSLSYILGITAVRSAAYLGSILALLIIVWRLLT
jgi:uncharacterized MAPEG superfamily protein